MQPGMMPAPLHMQQGIPMRPTQSQQVFQQLHPNVQPYVQPFPYAVDEDGNRVEMDEWNNEDDFL